MDFDLDKFRYGWELEFQMELGGGEIDRDSEAYQEWLHENITDIGENTIIGLGDYAYRRLCSRLNVDTETQVYVKDVVGWRDWARDYIENHYELPYCEPEHLNLPCSIQQGEDGSVNGGELRLRGPCNYADTIVALKDLEQQYDFKDSLEVDHECSFHVHISYEGVKHMYGEHMQMHMYEYLLNNIEKVPTTVLQRWIYQDENEDSWLGQYFDIRISQDKYNFVAFRSRFKTWEFRCFGNIKDSEEGTICIDLATQAYIYARTNVLNKVEPTYKGHYNDEDDYIDIKNAIITATYKQLEVRRKPTCAAS